MQQTRVFIVNIYFIQVCLIHKIIFKLKDEDENFVQVFSILFLIIIIMKLMLSSPSTPLAHKTKQFLFSTQKKPSYRFNYGSHMIPHPAKAHKGGEDAMFASDNVLVVADGVGGWADQGVDPGLYSKKLCSIIG